MNNPPDQVLKNAIGKFLKDADNLTLRPMIGNYVLFAEVINPDTGELAFVRLRTPEMTLWTEFGIMSLRAEEIRYEWMQQRMLEQAIGIFGRSRDEEEGI